MVRFKSNEHQERYYRVAAGLGFSEGVPSDWAACLYILTMDQGTWEAVAPHVKIRTHEIYWAKIRRIPTGRGHAFLLHLAQYLYNGTGKVELGLLWETLDANNFRLAMSAFQIRRAGSIVIEEAV